MKKLTPQFRAIIIIALIITASLPAFAYDYKKNDIYYTIIDKEKKTVKVTDCAKKKREIVIPNSIKINGISYSVTEIDDEAFDYREKLKSVVIPNSVTKIGDRAFSYCTGLTSVTIGNSVTTIGEDAFWACDGLTSVNITDLSAWCKIDFGGFYANPLYYAKKLKLNGKEIKDLVIPNDITSIGDRAFSYCTGLTSATIPNSVTTIGSSAFSSCAGWTSVTIPNSVTTIGSRAFSYCTGLTSVTIPNSVTSIGNCAFYGCSGLTSIVVEKGNTKYDSRDNCNAIIETATNTLMSGCKNTTIPNSVTTIGNDAFSYCDGLTSVTIPNSVTSIDNDAFFGCSGLTSVTIPNSVTKIGDGAFYKCYGLTSVTIPNSVTSIGNSAFRGCTGLTSVTIPNSVKEIGDCAFQNCDSLEYVIITNPNTRYNCNYNTRYNCNYNKRYNDNYNFYYYVYTFPKHTKIIRPKQEEKSERDSYRWQYVSYGDDKCGAKSTDGKEIVPTEYSEVEYIPNYEGYFLVRKNGCYAIYNPSGKIIIPISRGYSSIIKTRSDGRIYYRVSKGGKYGVCGIDGYEIVAPLYDNIICIDGVFLYKDINGTWIPLNKGLDKNNAVVENPKYTKRDVAYYDLALQQGRLEDSFGKKVRVEQTSTEGTRAFKIVFEDKILFEFGEYDLSSSALDYIDKVAETLKELPSTRVRITGYTDNVGSLASNRLLSTQRANAVSEYLQQKGISASRIIAKGVPLADYVATNKTEEGRALNRRVEIIIEAIGHRAK